MRLTLLAEVWVNQNRSGEHGEHGRPVLWQHWQGKLPSSPRYLQHVGDLTQPLTSYSTWENRPCVSPGQHSRVDPVDGVQVSQC